MTRFTKALSASACAGSALLLAGVWHARAQRSDPIRFAPVTEAQATLLDSAGMSMGPNAAPVFIRIAGDYQCGACQRLDEVAGRLLRKQAAQGIVRYSYIHAPLAVNRRGAEAAAAAYCAEAQGRGFAMHELLAHGVGDWGAGEPASRHFAEYATRLGLDTAAFAVCLTTPRTSDRVALDARAARSLGTTYVPVVVVGDQLVEGASPERLIRLIGDRLRVSSNAADHPNSAYDETTLPEVTAVPLRRGDLVSSITASGIAVAERSIALPAALGARVMRVAVPEGQAVEAGDTIVSLDPEAPLLAVRDARIRYEQARLGFEEVTLFDERITDAAIRASRERSARVRSGLGAAEIALARARRDLAATAIRAPISGIVAHLEVEAGEVVQSGQVVAELASLDALYVEVRVLEADLHKVKPGASATVEAPGLPEALHAQVTGVSPTIDPATNSGVVRLAVSATRSPLRPGMHVTASIEVGRLRDRVIAPRSALLARDGRPFIFLFGGEAGSGRAQWRYVEVEATSDSLAALVASHADLPLVPGSLVLTAGHSALVHDARVRTRYPSPT